MKDKIATLNGGWLVLAGVIVICPDALLVRLIQADHMTASFWRLGLLFIALLFCVLWVGMRRGENVFKALRPSLHDLVAGAFYCGASVCFIVSVQNTMAANTLVIIAANPLLGAVIAFFIFKKQLALRTWGAAIIVLLALSSIVGVGLGGENSFGDLMALATALCLAFYFNILNSYKQIDNLKAMMFGALFAAIIFVPFAHPLAVYGYDPLWLMLLGFWVLPVSFGLISLGAKRISAPETGLIMLLESILGSFLVWLVIGEVPETVTVLCGAIVIGTLIVHGFLGMQNSSRNAIKNNPD